jgi:hypothetical protein
MPPLPRAPARPPAWWRELSCSGEPAALVGYLPERQRRSCCVLSAARFVAVPAVELLSGSPRPTPCANEKLTPLRTHGARAPARHRLRVRSGRSAASPRRLCHAGGQQLSIGENNARRKPNQWLQGAVQFLRRDFSAEELSLHRARLPTPPAPAAALGRSHAALAAVRAAGGQCRDRGVCPVRTQRAVSIRIHRHRSARRRRLRRCLRQRRWAAWRRRRSAGGRGEGGASLVRCSYAQRLLSAHLCARVPSRTKWCGRARPCRRQTRRTAGPRPPAPPAASPVP